MGSSGAAVDSLTVPARGGTDGKREPAGVLAPPLRPLCSVPVVPGEAGALCAPCSVDGLGASLDLCGLVCAQPIVVVLQIFDHALEVAHPRPQSIALPHETIVEIHPLTQ